MLSSSARARPAAWRLRFFVTLARKSLCSRPVPRLTLPKTIWSMSGLTRSSTAGWGLPGGRAGFGAPNRFRWSDKEPYTSAPGSPEFSWSRSRIVGGRTNHYGRISLRFADYDFRGRSLDGYGEDWPITYEDLAPYYDKAERLIGVYGSKEGIRSAPDGIFQPPPEPKCLDHLVKRVCDKVKIPCIAGRRAVLDSSA